MIAPRVPTFAAIGHVTDDRLLMAGGVEARTPGGSALYAGLAAAALGARALVVTACARGADAIAALEAARVAVDVRASSATTTFENDHRGAARVQRVRAVASPLETAPVAADVVFVCPVAGEVRSPAASFASGGALVGVGLQGFLRRIDADGSVSVSRALAGGVLAGVDVAFVSREDLGFDDDLATALARAVPVLVVTDGTAGAIVHGDGAPRRVPAAPAREIDPTGAGDLFATAFLLATAHGATPIEAAIEGACAGAIAVEAVGTSSIAGLAAMQARREAWRRARRG